MAAPRTKRQPTFFWQGLLILLPVAVLAVVGVISLRQDKIIAQHDAIERAEIIADDLAARIWNEFTAKESSFSNPSDGLAFEVDSAGQLMFPPDFIPVPLPKPLDLAELNAGQTRLWLKLQDADASRQNSEAVIQAFRNFISSHPPERFAAAAGYGLGLVLVRQGKNGEAAEMFDQVVKNYPEAVGESGLPFQPLAQLKWLQLAATTPDIAGTNSLSLESLYSNIVYHPTLLTPELLKQAEQLPAGHPGARSHSAEHEKWERLWQNHAAARRLYAAAREHLLAHINPTSASFPLVSISTDNGKPTPTNVSFPRLFWFTTPELLFVPKAPGPGRGTASSDIWSIAYDTRRIILGTDAPDASRRTNAPPPASRWVAGGMLDRNWLAIGSGDKETDGWFVCLTESEIISRVNELLSRERSVPDYLGISVEIAGRKISAVSSDLHLWHYVGWNNPHSPGGGEHRDYTGGLATNVLAAAMKSEQGTELMKINVYLTSPTTLYQRQGARAFWFGLLVAASAVAAVIGLLAAWRAFRQQRQLNELKSNFVSSVSHELRAPIASVRLMAENLEGGKIPEPQKQKEHGADPNTKDSRGNTSLVYALWGADPNKIELLLDHHADPNVRDENGQTPLDYVKRQAQSNVDPASKAGFNKIENLLRRHGALDNLPNWDRITVSRPSANYSTMVFQKGINDWNRFTLLELIAKQYGFITDQLSGSANPPGPGHFQTWVNASLSFPDFKHVVIHRPASDGRKWTSIPVDVSAILESGDCSRDITLQWGDAVEIPETDHPVSDVWQGFTSSAGTNLIHCISRSVKIVVQGTSTEFKPTLEYATQNPSGFAFSRTSSSFMVRAVLDQSKLIRFSSDLSRVKVTHRDPKTGKKIEWVINCAPSPEAIPPGSSFSQRLQTITERSRNDGQFGAVPDLWLRDGDVIEVPEK